jgi:hypothetical protein
MQSHAEPHKGGLVFIGLRRVDGKKSRGLLGKQDPAAQTEYKVYIGRIKPFGFVL